jgi:hypothetical protein
MNKGIDVPQSIREALAEARDMLPKVGEPENVWTMVKASTLRVLVDALASPVEAAQRVPQWPSARAVQRPGDMGLSTLRVLFDSDNDVIVEVVEGDTAATFRRASIEFCNGLGGGGKSPRTREALIALMVAMESDAEPPMEKSK